MAIKTSVFASKLERDCYQKLARVWGDQYHIYHNLPFLSVLTPEHLIEWGPPLRVFTVTTQEFGFLKKTSIDFVLCDKEDRPILGIELDGLGDGFNAGTRYQPRRMQIPDSRRRSMSVKLRVAHGSLFPYVVLNSDHFRTIGSSRKHMIVDGIIGDVLAKRAIAEKIGGGFRPDECGWDDVSFSRLSQFEQHEVIQDWFLGVEVDCEHTHNPLTRERWKMQEVLEGCQNYNCEYQWHPELPASGSPEERGAAMKTALLHGVRCRVQTRDFGKLQHTIMLPNFETPGFSAFSLLEDIGFLLLFDRILKLRQR